MPRPTTRRSRTPWPAFCPVGIGLCPARYEAFARYSSMASTGTWAMPLIMT
jgi:hypothetical protein